MVENLHHSLKFKHYQLLVGVTGGADGGEYMSELVTLRKELPPKTQNQELKEASVSKIHSR